MNTPHTVLVVAPYFPPHTGGLERYAYEVAARTHASGDARVVVLTTSETGAAMVEHQGDMTIHRLLYKHKLSNSPFSCSWFLAVRRVLKEVEPDLVHIHTPVPGLGDLVSFLTPRRTPVLITYHAGSMRKGRLLLDLIIGTYERCVLPLMLKRAQHIACSSEYVRTKFLGRYMHKSSTITPAVDSTTFVRDSTDAPHAPTVLVVGGLARGEDHKGFARMLDILPQLIEAVPDVRVLVAGDGDRKGELQKRADDFGAGDAVTFLGRLDTVGMVNAYKEADVFAHPTDNDSFPTVILEAMACGVPVVSTTVGSIDAMVDDHVTGYLVAPDDADAFCRHLVRVLTDRSLGVKLGVAGREKVQHVFNWDTTAKNYTSLYRSLCSPKQCVAHVVAYYPPHTGGMEVVAERLAHGQAREGYTVEVLTSTVGAGKAPRVERATNLRVRRLWSFEFAHTPFMPSLLFWMLTVPRNTIVHVHIAQVYVPEIAFLVARLKGLRLIAHFHLDVEPSGFFGQLFVWYKKTLLPYILRQSDAVLVASAAQAELVVQTHGVLPEKVKQIVNAVDSAFFQTRAKSDPHTPLRVLTVSRLTIQKRVDRLIDAVALLSFPAELVIVGDGEDRAKLEQHAQKHAALRVRFVGSRTHDEIRSYHAWADVFVVPSDKEGGMPLTVLEAMAAGVPIVGVDTDGVRELVHGVGIVAEPTPEALAAGLTTLYETPETLKTLSEKSAERVKDCTWETALRRLEEVYSEVAF